MNVLHVCADFPYTEVYRQLLLAVPSFRHTVYVPLPTGAAAPPRPDLGFCRLIYSADYHPIHRVFHRYKQRRIFQRLRRQVALGSFQCVHAHSLFSAGQVAAQIKKAYGVPYMVAVRNSDVNVYFRFGCHLRRRALKILQGAERIIFLSPAYRSWVLERYVPARVSASIARKVRVIPNGVHPFWLENQGKPRSRPRPGAARILFAGELTANKNVVRLIQACELLRAHGRNVTLDIVGSGDDLGRVRAAADRSGLARLHGRISTCSGMLARFRQADLFVMPSLFETFGLVYLEAMSQGLPVIYSRGQGIDGFFADGEVGYAADPRKVADLAGKISRALDDYDRLSAACVAAAGRFSWTRIGQSYQAMYGKLAGDSVGDEGGTGSW